MFEAVRGSSFTGDIAIDDIVFNNDQNCQRRHIVYGYYLASDRKIIRKGIWAVNVSSALLCGIVYFK